MLIENHHAYPLIAELPVEQVTVKKKIGKGATAEVVEELVFETHPKTGEKIPVTRAPEPLAIPPGISRISKEKWDRVSDHPMIAMRLTGKTMDGYAVDPKSPEARPTLRVVSDGDDLPKEDGASLAIIDKTTDPDVLKHWGRSSHKVNVKQAIELQILKLEDPVEYVKRKPAPPPRTGARF